MSQSFKTNKIVFFINKFYVFKNNIKKNNLSLKIHRDVKQ